MKLYTCKVRLVGEVKDEVLRTGVTHAEIKVLRAIHGEDAVLDIAPTGEDAKTSYFDDNGEQQTRLRTEEEERARLEAFYDEKIVVRVFGVARQSIADDPSAIEGVMGATIPLAPVARAEPRPARPAGKLQLEDVGA